MFTRPKWLDTSSRKFRRYFLIVFIILIVGIEAIANILVATPVTTAIPATAAIPATTAMPAMPGKNVTPTWLCQHALETANPVQAENFCPGTTSWRADRPFGPQHAIEGFTSPISVQDNETMKIYVSTTAQAYSFEIYRMGWYNGLGGRLVYSSAQLPGIQQPAPIIEPGTHMVSCSNWSSQVSLQIPSNWVSGVYVIKLLAGKYMRYISFVLRDDKSHSAILVQTSVLTYEAYNLWGNYSLYRGPGSDGTFTPLARAYAVSFDRPFLASRGDGLGEFPLFNEYNLVRWLERSGYDVSYSTDIDTDQRGAVLLQHRLFIAAGHDEYWSTAMREHVTAARDAGVSLAFFGANDSYWHVRLQSSPLGPDREVICYKVGYFGDGVVDPLEATQPDQTTSLWRSAPLNQPENELLGEMYAGAVSGSAPLVLASGAQPFYASTSLHAGSVMNGLVGGEYDRVFYNSVSPAHLIILAHSAVLSQNGKRDTTDATLYTAASGARVFDAGTFYWAWGLNDDSFDPNAHVPPQHYATPAFQQFTANILAYLLKE